MATVKIKFRPSTVDGKQGILFYQIIHNRTTRQQKTNYHLYASEWDSRQSMVILPKSDSDRWPYLSKLSNDIKLEIKLLHSIIARFEHNLDNYTADDVFARFSTEKGSNSLFKFIEEIIAHLRSCGKIRTSETYATTLRSFRRFRNDCDMSFDEITIHTMMTYESYLRKHGVSPNSSSFYMRNLRAIYNRAVDRGLTSQHYPFKHVYTGVDKTIKRAVSLKVIKRIKALDFASHRTLDYARDMFLFSFYTRGMSFVDMAYLRKSDLANGILSYRRRKTGQQLYIKWEQCMQEIVDKYDTCHSNYLLPIIKPRSDCDDRQQYIYAAHNINRCLKIIGQQLELSIPLTLYVARHAWASIAKSKNIPISVISEGMGHDSEATTRIYLASLDTTAIDRANSMILKSL